MNVAIVTVSTRASAGVYEDRSGDRLAELVETSGHVVARRELVPDGRAGLATLLARLADEGGVDVIVTSGGTGLTPTDHTPEATADVVERLVPGIAEAIRARSIPTVPAAALSRGLAGVRGTTLIVNLPGSLGGAADGWKVIAPILGHAVSQIHGGDHSRTSSPDHI